MGIILTRRPATGLAGGLPKTLRVTASRITKAVLWRIQHAAHPTTISLKVGRYVKGKTELECSAPKSELTLGPDELLPLLEFIADNYEPFRDGVKNYIPIAPSQFEAGDIARLRQLFNSSDKREVLKLVLDHNIMPLHVIEALGLRARTEAVSQFARMLAQDLREQEWQLWFKNNSWVLGTEFVRVLGERDVDTKTIADYLMQAYDGFLDIVEIKRPGPALPFWADRTHLACYYPSGELTKAIAQASRYILAVERQANSLDFTKNTGGVPVVKPRCVLVYGRSGEWNSDQREAYRILNSSYHNLSILTYDHVLARARRILDPNGDWGLSDSIDDIPF